MSTNETYIAEFEVIIPVIPEETKGEIYRLSQSGDYIPESTLSRSFSLLYFLDNPAHYRVCAVVERGRCYVIPADRPKNPNSRIAVPQTKPPSVEEIVKALHNCAKKTHDENGIHIERLFYEEAKVILSLFGYPPGD